MTILSKSNFSKPNALLCLLILICSAFSTYAQQKSQKEIKKEIASFVDDYWKAYNECDVESLLELESENLEFYHDQAGTTLGADESKEAWEIMCGGDWSVRAEHVGALDIDLMYSNGSLYGSVISGELRFFEKYKDEEEKLTEKSEYTTLLKYEDQEWYIHRVFSYSHEPAD